MEKTSRITIALIIATAIYGMVGPSALAGNGRGNDNSSSNNISGSSNSTSSDGLSSDDVCYTAVYDQQTADGTYAHYGKGEWDADRRLCMHVKSFTQSFLPKVGAVEAAQNNPFIHVMYVIDRTNARIYAPCGIASGNGDVAGGVLSPGTYDLNTLTKVDSGVPSLGAGANCVITG